MSRSVVLLLVLVFVITSCIAVKPAFSSADVAEDSWVSKSPMNQARYALGVAVVNGKIYAIGGQVLAYQDAMRTESKDVGTNEEYDPTTDTWTMKSPMPTPRNSFAIAVYQNKIYCIGSGVNEVYDPATDSWTTKAPMPNITYGCISAVVDNEIYFISGLSKVQIYDAETDTWRLGAPPPLEVYWGSAVATTGVMAPKRVYALGISGYVPEHFVRIYDVETDTWMFGANIPTMRSDFGVAVVNDMLYVVGGYTLVYPDKVAAPYVPTLVPYATNEQYTPFGYGTAVPIIDVVSPVSQTYHEANVPLVFTLNKPVSWIGYSLDGQESVTVTGNTTIAGFTNGMHNVTVYAEDSFGNTGASETVSFSVEIPFPTVLVATASGASATIIAIGLLIYFKKRKH